MPAAPSKVIPFLLSTDINRTVDFYTATLAAAGFALGGMHNHTPELDPDALTFASIYAGPKAAVNIYFRTGLESGPGKVIIMLDSLNELDELWAAVSETDGVRVLEEVGDKPWGYR